MTTDATRLDRVIIIIPTYNEIENIDPITSRIRASVPDADILITDDNSPDGTGRRADELAAADPHIKVLHRQGKEGLSAAYLASFRWALGRDYDVIVEFDADGSHQPEELPRLLAGLADADMVKGSRWVKGGSVVNWPKKREWLSRGGSAYTRLMLGLPIRDISGGLNLFRASLLRDIVDEVDAAGYGIQRDLTMRAFRKGYRVVELPITFIERERGQSKMGSDVVIEALRKTTELGVAYRGGQLKAALDDSPAVVQRAAGIAAGAGRLGVALGRTVGRTVTELVRSAGRR